MKENLIRLWFWNSIKRRDFEHRTYHCVSTTQSNSLQLYGYQWHGDDQKVKNERADEEYCNWGKLTNLQHKRLTSHPFIRIVWFMIHQASEDSAEGQVQALQREGGRQRERDSYPQETHSRLLWWRQTCPCGLTHPATLREIRTLHETRIETWSPPELCL